METVLVTLQSPEPSVCADFDVVIANVVQVLVDPFFNFLFCDCQVTPLRK